RFVFVDVEEGRAFIVTDLHGDWDAYRRYRDKFFELNGQNQADFFCVLGDMIHFTGPEASDRSVDIVLDLIHLQEKHPDKIRCVLGNHELPHIYSITLQKGNEFYTPRFEKSLKENREKIITFFDTLPFYLRTTAGVTLCHAGATAAISQKEGMERLCYFSHQALLEKAREAITPEERPSLMRAMRKLHNRTYNEMARNYFDVTGVEDPRYDDFLIGTLASSSNPDFNLLWDALFTRNEKEYGREGYKVILENMLLAFSKDFAMQRFIVSGHINVRGGYEIINNVQLRLASAKHASPREAGQYLLLDCQEKVRSVSDLTKNLGSVFTS
ncbi:MAG: metallophosphoesterase, partial [Chloroflexota bacterium]